jgi:plastocyanin/uncharacterized membrane protein YozB (DUF420 family)
MSGVLGMGGTPSADINLLVQLAMAIALTIGMFLARKKRFRAHGWTQSSVLILNLVAIGSVMVPSFHRQVLPHVASAWHDAYYAVAVVHATAGTLVELLGLYVVLVAGTTLLPERLRFRNYKLWMRTTLALWWTVVILGVAVYAVWYILPSPGGPRGTPGTVQQAGVTVSVSNFLFEPKQVTVRAGGTVTWVDARGRHALVADNGSFASPILLTGSRFQHTFQKRGVFNYYCRFHGGAGGQDMAGTVVVR